MRPRYNRAVRQRVPARLARLPRRLFLKNGESRSDALFRSLGQVARSSRTAQDQIFYSLREVAGHFALPVSLVSRVFGRLESEGLLGRVRGSRTLLRGRKFDRHLYVRGVVGLPVSILRFSVLAEYRSFILQLRRRLRRRGFMPAAVFFSREEARGSFLVERLLEARADVVLWYSPRNVSPARLDALHDAGVRVLGVRESRDTRLPCRYEVRRGKALRRILHGWRTDGLGGTIVVTAPRWRSPLDEEEYRQASKECSLRSKIIVLEPRDLTRSLGKLARSGKRGLLITASAAALCQAREATRFAQLLAKRQSALVEGAVSFSFATIPDIALDLITTDWETVADRIVGDLVTGSAWANSEPVIFEAAARLQTPLNQFCGEI